MNNEKFLKKVSLREDEEPIMLLHHHLIGYAKQILVTVVIIFLSFFLMYPLFNYLDQIGVALFCALLLTGIVYGSREFYIWYNNIFLITSQRVVDIDQKGFFEKIVSEIPYEKISDISYSVKGFWQSVLKLGTIRIKAESVDLVVKNITEVARVNQTLVDMIRQDTGKKLEVKKVSNVGEAAKEKLTDEFLNQDKMAEYDDYNLAELVEEYSETYGELSLKKMLAEELKKSDKKDDDEMEEVKFTRR
ncbi:MAG: PH domain-containing protein [Patescibacteria group bacterium]|nr:PH domain-containing protein [Patescibacteria group bacterium]